MDLAEALSVGALHKLSFATRPRFQDDLLDWYLQWALLRYLGFFELGPHGDQRRLLRVSAAGRRIVGNQRRITSEELGIGFGGLLADHWLRHSADRRLTVNLVDVDVALDDQHVLAGGTKHSVQAAGSRRPDYLLLAKDPSSRLGFRVRLLECKGTRNRNHAVRQLAKAVGQLDGITVAGRIPPGLAVSTITADDQVSYLALDPADGDEPTYEADPDLLQEPGRFQLGDDTRDVPAWVLVSASLRGSWATLADFGGNLAAVDRWAPEVMRRRLDRRRRQRESWETPYGIASGTSTAFTFDNQTLTVRHGIDAALDQRLSGSAIEPVIEAQADFAERLAEHRSDTDAAGEASATGLADLRDVHSASPDGSIFSLLLT